jgi:hypothetical protein
MHHRELLFDNNDEMCDELSTHDWYINKHGDNNQRAMYTDDKTTKLFLYFKQLLRVISSDCKMHKEVGQ